MSESRYHIDKDILLYDNFNSYLDTLNKRGSGTITYLNGVITSGELNYYGYTYPGLTSFTISVDVIINSLTLLHVPYIIKSVDNSFTHDLSVRFNSNGVGLSIQYAEVLSQPSYTFEANKSYNITITVLNNLLITYVNGEYLHQLTSAFNYLEGPVGLIPTSAAYFKNFKMWRKVLSGAEIKNLYNKNIDKLKEGLIGYHPINGNANDESGNGYDGVVTGGASLVNDRNSKPNSAYYLDGINGQIRVNYSLGLTIYSIAVWVKIPTPSTSALYDYFMDISNPLSGTQGLIIRMNKIQVFDGSSIQTIQPYSDTGWNFLVIIQNGSSISISLNAEELNTVTINPITFNYLSLGSRLNGFGDTEATYDDIRVYNRALTIEEIEVLYKKKY